MPTRLRKSRKKRGTRVCGWGRVGQHRKSGGKGGRGMAGLHKHKWSWTVKHAPDHFGYKGFYRHPRPTVTEKWVNVGQLDHIHNKLADEGRVEERDGVPVIDLSSMGVEKLLGGGRVASAYYVMVPSATKRAVKKVEEAGGRVEIVGRKTGG